MLVDQMYPSKYIKSEDLKGQRVKLQIASVVIEEVGDNEHKPVMRFINKQKGCVVNKTNAMALAVAFGDDSDRWIGREIELLAMPVMFNGKQVLGLHMLPIGLSTPAAQAGQPLSNDQTTQAQFQQPGPHDFVAPDLPEQDIAELANDIANAEKDAGINF